MREVFADSGYWIGLLHPRDQHHDRATEKAAELGDTPIVTTQMVLVEVLSQLSGKRPAVPGSNRTIGARTGSQIGRRDSPSDG